MASILKVNTIQDATNSNTAMSVNSSGLVTTPARPAFMVYPTGNFDTGSGAGTTQTFTGVDHNIGNHYSTSTGKFTCPVDGVYLFGATLALASATTVIVYMSAEIMVNGSKGSNKRYHGGWGEKDSSTNTHHREQFVLQISLDANDTVQFAHEVNTNCSALGGQGGRHTSFWGHLIG